MPGLSADSAKPGLSTDATKPELSADRTKPELSADPTNPGLSADPAKPESSEADAVIHRRVSISTLTSASSISDFSTLAADVESEFPSAPKKKVKVGVFASVLAFLRGVFDRRVLTNPLYILFIVCTSICMSAAVNQTTFIVPRAEEVGISREMAAVLLSVIGGCDVIGRILLGLLADMKRLSPHQVMAGGVMVTSTCMCALPFAKTFAEMAAVAVIFGLFGSSHAILNLPVMVEFVGKDLLAKAVGMSIFFYGGFGAILAPLLGLVKDRVGSFSTVFYVTASMQMFAAILLTVVEPLVRRRVAAKKNWTTYSCDKK